MKESSRFEGITPRAGFESGYLSGEYCAGYKKGPPLTMKRFCPKILFLIFALYCAGCASLPLESDKKTGLNVHTKEKMTLILNHALSKKDGDWLSSNEAQTWEQKIHNTFKDILDESEVPIQVISPQEFRRMVFPDLGFEVVPHSPEYLSVLLKQPAFKKRLELTGIRFLVVVSGQSTAYQHAWGDIVCGGGYGGGGCFGLKTWKKDCYFRAFILDAKQPCNSGEVNSEASGHAWLAFIGVLPIGLPAFSESKAYQALGEELVKFLENLMRSDSQKSAAH
jgi:hypothetical protein